MAEPEALVQLAILKAQACPEERVVVAADTAVIFEGKILGKPDDEEGALKMLLSLKGRTHLVITAVAATHHDKVSSSYCSSVVSMRDYTHDEVRAYIASGKAMDKAGGYAIQDKDFKPVASYEGCYLNIVGLPLCALVRVLRELGFNLENFNKPSECQGCQVKDQL